MSYGEEFVGAVANYLKQHGLTSLGKLNRVTLAQIADEHYFQLKERERIEGSILTDSEWIAKIKAEPLFAGIDISAEHMKADLWCRTNQKGCTRKFFSDWLGRSLNNKPISLPPPQPKPTHRDPYAEPKYDWRSVVKQKWPIEEYPARDLWENGDWKLISKSHRELIINAYYENKQT